MSEAGKVERDDVVGVAQCLVDRLPADRPLSDSVQQDQWLTRSGSMMGEIVEGGGRRQAGRDEISLVGGRLQSTVTRPTPTANRSIPRMCLWVAGHSSVETIRDQVQRAIAAAGTPSETLPGEEVRSMSVARRSSPAWNCAGLARPVAGGSDSGLRA